MEESITDATDRTLAERAELRAEVARLRDAIRAALAESASTGHYAHHDPEGRAGAACPACHARGRAVEHLSGALRPNRS